MTVLRNALETWIASSEEFEGISQGNEKDDDLGFVDIQPGLIDGQGLIFLQEKWYTENIVNNKQLYYYQACNPFL